mgnify:CR=1 FL=1
MIDGEPAAVSAGWQRSECSNHARSIALADPTVPRPLTHGPNGPGSPTNARGWESTATMPLLGVSRVRDIRV